jgi:hypothetical protein
MSRLLQSSVATATLRKAISATAIALLFTASAAPASAAAVASAAPAPATFLLELTVPVLCNVSYTADAATTAGDANGAFDLGKIGEYCNAGAGYTGVVDYAPGTLKGAVLQLGTDRVVLDGSGEAVIAQAAGPRIRQRELVATPGANGFDSPELSFQIHPTSA